MNTKQTIEKAIQHIVDVYAPRGESEILKLRLEILVALVRTDETEKTTRRIKESFHA